MTDQDDQPKTSCGFVALVGAPNAGKSTLLNQLVGAKISIVSRKVQTTRTQVKGIAIEGQAQIIFIDTPGIFTPKRKLDQAMVTSAWGGAGDADVIALLIDARKGLDEETLAIAERLKTLKSPKIAILNKIDLLPSEELLELATKINALMPFKDTFMISALKGFGTQKLLKTLSETMRAGPWLYPDDQMSDASLRVMAAELTREALYDRLHNELPYQSTVETDSWQEKPDGSIRIEQTIFVSRDGHKKIVIGEGGQTIKAIGQRARHQIQELTETKVHLFLFVKVRENWENDPERYRVMGLEFPRG
jgi:GTP-binding protein Era